MTLIALLSNPLSTGNRQTISEIRSYCHGHDDILHLEIDGIGEIARSLETIAGAKPDMLVINGGDGTVQAVLTHIYNHRPFGKTAPPIAVLPNGKTNLIAQDLGMKGSAISAMDHLMRIAKNNIADHTTHRSLIALSDGHSIDPVLGMFLAGEGLMDIILFCRRHVYPIGLPDFLSHFVTAIISLVKILIFGRFSKRDKDVRMQVKGGGILDGRFHVVLVTTLNNLLLGIRPHSDPNEHRLKLLCIEETRMACLRCIIGLLTETIGNESILGVHVRYCDRILIEGNQPSVILDGELVQAAPNAALQLTSTQPLAFITTAKK